MLTLTNRIDMRPGAVPLVIHLGQYDSDFSLVFELYSSAGNFTVESGTTAMIRGTKTDGNAYDADATIDVSAKTVTVAGSEQMTAAKGRNVYELVLKKGTKVLSTANFILDVERAAMDADTIASESVLKELNAIIDSAATSTQAAANAASAADRAEDAAESVSSASAQIATNTADIADLKEDLDDIQEEIEGIEGLSVDIKEALLACFRNVAYTTSDSQTLYDNLHDALYASDAVASISAVYTQGGAVIYPDDSLDNLRASLIVTATYVDSHTGVVTGYSLSGTLVGGTSSTITVTYMGKTTTFTVAVTDYEWGSDYTWLYRPEIDGLLSANENVSATVGINGTPGTESLEGNILNVSASYTSASSGNIYKLIPLTGNGVLKAKVRFNALAKSTVPSGFRIQVSNGTNGAQMFAYRNAGDNTYRIASHQGDSQYLLVNNIELERWYILSCQLDGNKQVLKVDDATFTINSLANYANTETRVIVQQPGALSGYSDIGDVDVDIAWVSFKDNSAQ